MNEALKRYHYLNFSYKALNYPTRITRTTYSPIDLGPILRLLLMEALSKEVPLFTTLLF